MKGPSEEQVPYTNQPSYYQNMPYYNTQASQYAPAPQHGNANGNNGNYHHYSGQDAGQVGFGSYYYPYHSAAEQSPTPSDESNPFAEYAWMADPEEFEKQVLEQMEQEEYLEACFQQLWDEEEEDEWCIPAQGDAAPCQTEADGLSRLTLNETQPPTMLNPNAAEFVPRWAITHQ